MRVRDRKILSLDRRFHFFRDISALQGEEGDEGGLAQGVGDHKHARLGPPLSKTIESHHVTALCIWVRPDGLERRLDDAATAGGAAPRGAFRRRHRRHCRRRRRLCRAGAPGAGRLPAGRLPRIAARPPRGLPRCRLLGCARRRRGAPPLLCGGGSAARARAAASATLVLSISARISIGGKYSRSTSGMPVVASVFLDCHRTWGWGGSMWR